MPFWKCYYHVIWATKGRQSIITPARERVIFGTIRQVSEDMGCDVWAANGVTDHVHVAVSIPPHTAVAEWVKRCKGASSRYVNQMSGEERFSWQSGYGVLTFGQNALAMVTAYIDRQKVHHAQDTVQPYLERIE